MLGWPHDGLSPVQSPKCIFRPLVGDAPNHSFRASIVDSMLLPMRRVVNAMGIALYGSDAVCMGMLALSASKLEGTATASRIDTAVMVIQLIALAGELVLSIKPDPWETHF